MHFTDIGSWSDDRFEDVHISILESVFEMEQLREIHRTDNEKAALKRLYEKHRECISEWNRRMAAKTMAEREITCQN